MGLPWSTENILGWRTQYQAVCRWRDRCRRCYSDGHCTNEQDFVDYFLAFMINCYSLRHFVIQTGQIPKQEMDELIKQCESMRICRDICNRAKHYAISGPSIDPQWSLGREWIPGSDGSTKYFLIVEDQKQAPLSVVEKCERFWRDLIAEKKFAEPGNPFRREAK